MFVDSNVVVHIFVSGVVALSVLVRKIMDLFFIPYRIIVLDCDRPQLFLLRTKKNPLSREQA